MYKGKKIGVVVPVYNEEKHLAEVVKGMPSIVDIIVIVDDKSRDSSLKVAKSFKDKRVIVKAHECNMGVGGAVITGHKVMIEKGMDISVVMAGDAQMDPKYLPELLDPLVEEGYDYAKGNRFLHRTELRMMPLLRIFGNMVLTFFTKIASGYWQIFDPQNGYTAVKTSALKEINYENLAKRYEFENDMLVSLNIAGFRVKDVAIPAKYGNERSKISLLTFVPRTLWLLFNGFCKRIFQKYAVRNFHPIFAFFLVGVPLMLIGIGFGVLVTYNSFVYFDPPTTGQVLLTLLPFFVGLQLVLVAFVLDMLNEPK